jgi:hypothetical protein
MTLFNFPYAEVLKAIKRKASKLTQSFLLSRSQQIIVELIHLWSVRLCVWVALLRAYG